MSQNSQLPRTDGRTQPLIEESDEENLNYEEISSNKDGMPTTSSYPEKDSPQDLDHPDISNDIEEEKPKEIQFPGEEKSPLTEESNPNKEVEIVEPEEDDFLIDPEEDDFILDPEEDDFTIDPDEDDFQLDPEEDEFSDDLEDDEFSVDPEDENV